MLSTILNAFQVADIRKKIAFTAGMLLIYRLGSHIPVPGVNLTAVNNIQKQFGGSNILGLLNLFSGGGLSRIAIFALGIMPYITSSIILQLLQVAVPSLEKLSKEGEVGQARITQYTRYLTVGLAFAQSIGYVFLFHTLQAKAGESVVTHFDAPHIFLIVICLTTGCVLLMWIGELITQRGIGNGISLLIFASIVSRLPSGIQSVVDHPGPGLQGDDAVPRARRRRRDRVRAGRPAAHPRAVRQARDRPAHDRGRPDLPAAAREHGGRDPGDLRGQHHGLPADGRAARENPLGPADLGLLLAQRLALRASASRSSSSSSPTSTPPSRSTRSTRRTT